MSRVTVTRVLLILCALLALSALPPVRTGTVRRWLGRPGLAGVAATPVGVWIGPPVPPVAPPGPSAARPRAWP